MKFIFSSQQPGFTLIEALITLTLSLLLTGVGLVTYKSYYNHKIVKLVAKSWAKQVQLFIKKNESASILNDVSGCQGSFNGSLVKVTAISSNYSLQVKCSQTNSDWLSYSLDDFGNPKKVIFKDDQNIDILPLSQGIKYQTTVTFCLENTASCYYKVTIDKNGNIQIESI